MSDLTIRDIAKIAGVSTTAVSFVLNNRPGVSDATRQHVQEVIARTGFTPNVHTRRLNLGRSFSVHVVLYWHEHDLFNQFALEILHGVFQSCKQLGYSVVFTFVEKNMDCSQLMASIRSKDCDGVILSQIEDPLFITLLQQEHIPFVCVDSHVRRDGTLPLVEVDYYKAAYDSVMYLRRCGHTKIGYIAPTIPLELHLSTFSGYTIALRDCSLTCDPAWIGKIAFEPDAAGLYFEQLLQTGHLPTAFLCTGDPFAIDLIRRMKQHGLRIPQDMSVISMDDLLVSRYIDPPLTTVTFQKEELGRRAVNVLCRIIDGKPYESVNLLPVTIVERGSVRRQPELR